MDCFGLVSFVPEPVRRLLLDACSTTCVTSAALGFGWFPWGLWSLDQPPRRASGTSPDFAIGSTNPASHLGFTRLP
jgi:hypothetical protein